VRGSRRGSGQEVPCRSTARKRTLGRVRKGARTWRRLTEALNKSVEFLHCDQSWRNAANNEGGPGWEAVCEGSPPSV
jgi:hypothetical protein